MTTVGQCAAGHWQEVNHDVIHTAQIRMVPDTLSGRHVWCRHMQCCVRTGMFLKLPGIVNIRPQREGATEDEPHGIEPRDPTAISVVNASFLFYFGL